jgi:hypothetical protein
MTGEEDLKAEGRAGHADGRGAGPEAHQPSQALVYRKDRTLRTERTYG